MKKIYTAIIILIGFSLLPSCDYLDIVPDEVPSEKEAFADKEAARRYLYSCYSFIPNPREGAYSMDLWTSDENITAFENEAFADFPKGNYTAVNVSDKNSRMYKMSLWNGLFGGIRQCYILLDNIDDVPGMDDSEKQLYKAESTFLIAYYHFLLLRGYGPTIIVESLPDVNEANPENYLGRRPYDECVDWIANKFDEAIALGLKNSYAGSSEYGRGTATAAKALKGRMFLYAASPLFNGGSSSEPDTDNLTSVYQNLKNADGTQLISTTYDKSKWKRAADALEVAITAAKNDGVALYKKVPDNLIVEPTDPVQAVLRMTFIDRNTPEIIWPYAKKEGGYSVQNKSTPFDPDRDWSWNGISPSIEMVKTFYSSNGLPIDEDPAYDYANIEGTANHTGNIGNGEGTTLNLHLNREPRFYAWIAYHNSYYEIKRNGSTNKYLVKFAFNDNCGKNGRSSNYSPTGYLNKKGVHPNYRQGSGGGGLVDYSWPMIRLSELYLNCAEALIEVGDAASIAKAKGYIDEIRLRAGLKTLDEAWMGIATLDQAKLRKIVRQERSIELYMENHRFWDVRRWLLGTKYFNARPMGMAVNEANEASFLKIVDIGAGFERKFLSPQHYLMPIPIDDINRNPNIVQNPKY